MTARQHIASTNLNLWQGSTWTKKMEDGAPRPSSIFKRSALQSANKLVALDYAAFTNRSDAEFMQ